MDYSKFYQLDAYLFGEVTDKFRRDGFLSAEDFFCIVIWKANRAKTKIKKKLLETKNGNLAATVEKLTKEIYAASTNERRLALLLKKWQFGLPMATAILTVLYPEDFSVYDYRVREQLHLKNITSVEKYFSAFLPAVKAMDYQGSLRDKDKYMWGKSRYEDLKELLNKN